MKPMGEQKPPNSEQKYNGFEGTGFTYRSVSHLWTCKLRPPWPDSEEEEDFCVKCFCFANKGESELDIESR